MEMPKVEIKGTIVPNEDKWIYEWFGIDAVCPRDVQKVIAEANGEPLSIEVNSGGGDMFSGNEIYYLLNQYPGETTADIVGFAGSAATIICCGANRVRAVPGAGQACPARQRVAVPVWLHSTPSAGRGGCTPPPGAVRKLPSPSPR